MKKMMNSLLVVSSLVFVPIWASADDKDNLMLVVTTSSSEVSLLLSSTDNPDTVHATIKQPLKALKAVKPETSGLALVSQPLAMTETVEDRDDDEVSLLASVDKGLVQLKSSLPDHFKSDKTLPIAAVVMPKTSYDSTEESAAKDNDDKAGLIAVLNKNDFTPPGSEQHIVMLDMDRLNARAARQNVESTDELHNVDMIAFEDHQVKAYSIRDGKLASVSEKVTLPDNDNSVMSSSLLLAVQEPSADLSSSTEDLKARVQPELDVIEFLSKQVFKLDWTEDRCLKGVAHVTENLLPESEHSNNFPIAELDTVTHELCRPKSSELAELTEATSLMDTSSGTVQVALANPLEDNTELQGISDQSIEEEPEISDLSNNAPELLTTAAIRTVPVKVIGSERDIMALRNLKNTYDDEK